MRKAALLAGALALPLVVSLPAVAQQNQNAKPAQTGQQQPMQQSQNKGADNQPSGQPNAQGNGQAAQLNRDQIKQVQQALDKKGFKAGRPDGVIGKRTGQALNKFQKSQNLQQTGQPDDQTLQALGVNVNGASSGSATTGEGSSMDQNQPPQNQPSGNNNGGNSSTNSGQK